MIKNISKETQLVDWVEVKAWETIETRHAEGIVRCYPELFAFVEEKEEVKEEVKEVKKPAKKK